MKRSSCRFVLKGSSMVRYVLQLVPLQKKYFPGLGLYSGIFAMYLQCPSKRFGMALILFYAVCLLYVLSAATFASDLVSAILFVSNNSICKDTIFLSVVQTRVGTPSSQLQVDSQPMLLHVLTITATLSGCCDFLAQCILVRISHCTCHPHN